MATYYPNADTQGAHHPTTLCHQCGNTYGQHLGMWCRNKRPAFYVAPDYAAQHGNVFAATAAGVAVGPFAGGPGSVPAQTPINPAPITAHSPCATCGKPWGLHFGTAIAPTCDFPPQPGRVFVQAQVAQPAQPIVIAPKIAANSLCAVCGRTYGMHFSSSVAGKPYCDPSLNPNRMFMAAQGIIARPIIARPGSTPLPVAKPVPVDGPAEAEVTVAIWHAKWGNVLESKKFCKLHCDEYDTDFELEDSLYVNHYDGLIELYLGSQPEIKFTLGVDLYIDSNGLAQRVRDVDGREHDIAFRAEDEQTHIQRAFSYNDREPNPKW